jgi:hypothetical protein
MRLVKGLYGHEFRNESTLFGLRCGQMRADDIIHNGGWYNRQGEKLGWGDLSETDLYRIAAELEPGELFIVLPEGASYWDFGVVGKPKANGDMQAPGVDYVANNASWVIEPGIATHVSAFTAKPWRGFPGMSRESAIALIKED